MFIANNPKILCILLSIFIYIFLLLTHLYFNFSQLWKLISFNSYTPQGEKPGKIFRSSSFSINNLVYFTESVSYSSIVNGRH